MPLWAAIVIGLGSGVLGTLVSVRHQRGAELRTRMLDAAAEFLQAAEGMRRAARKPRGEHLEESLGVLRDRWDDLVPTVMMVELLFGRRSPAALQAQAAGSMFGDAIDSLEAGFAGDDAELAKAQPAVVQASHALERFADEAARQVRATAARRLLGRLHRPDVG